MGLVMKIAAGIVLALAVSTAALAAPPSGLTTYGRTIYNLDALLHDTYGRYRTSYCYRGFQTQPRVQAVSAFTVYCDDVPNADRIPYKPTFVRARRSAFKLLHLPNALTTLYKKPTITLSRIRRVERALGNYGALIWFVYDEAEGYEAVASCGNGRYLISGGYASFECFQP